MSVSSGRIFTLAEIHIGGWGVDYGDEDVVIYDPLIKRCSLYENSMIFTRPEPNETIPWSIGKETTLNELLDVLPFVVFDTDLGRILVLDMISGGTHTTTCPGDFDFDLDVDGSDLSVSAADFGRTDCAAGDTCEGDFDNDNDVDGSDLAVFASDFGRTDCP
jgi:hypothetical protein